MKRLALILCLFLCTSVCAADRVTITLTITNQPTAAQTLTINAAVKTWRSTVTIPASEVLIGANIGATSTNLFRQLASYPLSGPVSLGFSSSNVITIQGTSGQAMSASMSAAYGTVSYATNTVTPLYIVRVPMASEPLAVRTNNATLVTTGIGSYSQSPLAMSAGITLLTPTGATNSLLFQGGFAAIAPDGGGYPCLFNAVTGEPWEVGGDAEILNLYSAKLNFPQHLSVVTNSWLSTNLFGVIGSSSSRMTNMVARDGGLTNFALTNITLYATNYSTGIWGHTRANHTTLANGNNAGVDFGTKVYAKIKAGPTAAFTINGITGGSDGRMLILDNSIAQNMTIANDSGVEPTAANRIYTRTGADVATTAEGVVTLIYDSESSRWILVSVRD